MTLDILAEVDEPEFWRLFHFKLHIACMEGDIPAVELMMSMGADPDFRNEMGFTAVEWADTLRNVEVLKRLLQNVDIPRHGVAQLAKHIRGKHPAVVAVLLEMGVKHYLAQDALLHRGLVLLACHAGHVTIVCLLIQCVPGYQITPNKHIFLQVAAAAHNDEVLEFLRDLARDEQAAHLALFRRPPPLVTVYAPPRDPELDRLFHEFIDEDAYLP